MLVTNTEKASSNNAIIIERAKSSEAAVDADGVENSFSLYRSESHGKALAASHIYCESLDYGTQGAVLMTDIVVLEKGLTVD